MRHFCSSFVTTTPRILLLRGPYPVRARAKRLTGGRPRAVPRLGMSSGNDISAASSKELLFAADLQCDIGESHHKIFKTPPQPQNMIHHSRRKSAPPLPCQSKLPRPLTLSPPPLPLMLLSRCSRSRLFSSVSVRRRNPGPRSLRFVFPFMISNNTFMPSLTLSPTPLLFPSAGVIPPRYPVSSFTHMKN